MLRCAQFRAKVLLALASALLTGCAIRSPVLFVPRQSTTNPRQVPLRAGVGFEASRDLDPTNIVTRHLAFVIPIMTIYGQFPKPVESEYVQDAIVDYFRDHGVFKYTYPYPFDPQDVDVVVRAKPNTLVIKNNSLYSTLMPLIASFIPTIGALAPLVLPQEQFTADYAMVFSVQRPDGTEIASYQSRQSGMEWVWIYSQPFGNYMWYESVFRKKFMAMMDEVKSGIERDSRKIMAAAKPGGV